LARPVEIAWMMAALAHALVEVLGISTAPQLALVELNDAVIRVPWLGRMRNSDAPAFSVGLEGIEEDAAEIFLSEGTEPLPGEPGAFRAPHLDEGGFRPGMHALIRPGGSQLGHAVAAAAAVAIAHEAGGVITDEGGGWVVATKASAAHLPDEFLAALRSGRHYASVTDGAAALWARCPVAGRAPAPSGR
jgi:hypothetical protein